MLQFINTYFFCKGKHLRISAGTMATLLTAWGCLPFNSLWDFLIAIDLYLFKDRMVVTCLVLPCTPLLDG